LFKFGLLIARAYWNPSFPMKGGEEDMYYNSLSFIDNLGAILTTYDKTFLYEVDEAWASEGAGFTAVDTRDFGRVCPVFQVECSFVLSKQKLCRKPMKRSRQ
jgi:predicted amidohydrolase